MDILGIGRLFESVRDAVVVVDTHTGRIALWNPAAGAIFGYAPDEAAAPSIAALVPERLRACLEADLARYRETGQGRHVDAPAVVESAALRRDGAEFPVELTISPLRAVADGRRFVLAIVRDVTGRKRTRVAPAASPAGEQDRVERPGASATRTADFAAMIAHELGSSSATIRNYTALLADGGLSPGEQARIVAALRTETATLSALVADLDALASAERGDFAVHPRPVAVGALLDAAATFAQTLPGNHPFATMPPPDERVWADPERVGQVLRNLLTNAAKYSPAGSPIALRAARQGDRIRIEVADAGPGIRPADQARIFDKFARGGGSARTTRGSGLGLYLSRQIVRAHGAELMVESTPGAGSVFWFALDAVR